MKRILILCLVFFIICLSAKADDKVTFSASAPEAVAVGDQFRLSYTINTQSVRDFRVPSIKDFEVLMGPSRSYSMQNINGKTTETLTYTYILQAVKEGSFTIASASVRAKGQNLVSNSLTIKVLPADSSSPSNEKASGNREAAQRKAQRGRISDDDLLITATASKTKVFEQEAFLLTYKIYTAVELRGFDNVKLPDFKGFHSQEVELPADRKWGLEHYKGRNYQTTIYRQFVLFPQQTGQLSIEPAYFTASIAKSVVVDDPFEAFFNGGAGYVEVKKQLSTPKLTINSMELPAGKPDNFSGGVGEFTLSSSFSTTSLKTNDALTIKLIVSGTGNLKLLSTPEIKFPEDFDVYDPKIENNLRLTAGGLSGNQVIEYIAIPRNAGHYKIPALKFSYFDIKSKKYKTLCTEDYAVNVEKGVGTSSQAVANFTNKEDLKVLNEDIRFIKQNRVSLKQRGVFFFDSALYWLLYIVPGCLFILFFLIYRKQIAANANVAKMRTKKANKVAVKRMKRAGKLLANNQQDDFYDEVLKALWGYISDKLNIPVSNLSKDNVEEKLKEDGVEDNLINEFITTLNDCEFARFAPGNDNQAMDKIYTASLELISKMENSIKR